MHAFRMLGLVSPQSWSLVCVGRGVSLVFQFYLATNWKRRQSRASSLHGVPVVTFPSVALLMLEVRQLRTGSLVTEERWLPYTEI
jgi:hypothetical protein